MIQNPELRDLLEYVGEGNITASDIPSRQRVSAMIVERYLVEYEKMLNEIKVSHSFLSSLHARMMHSSQNAPGHVSFTTDLWSDPNLRSFMAVMAHYATRNEDGNGELITRTQLIAFRHIIGKHDGPGLAKAFLQVLMEFELVHRVSGLLV